MPYPGGKSGAGVYQTIINQIPPHRIYIEPFLGGGAIMRLKRPAAVSIGIDVDPIVIDGARAPAGRHRPSLRGRPSMARQSRRHDHGRQFIYCDPPYLMSTRSYQQNLYRHEFATEEEHRSLLSLLLQLPCSIAISGYASPLYAEMLAGWRSITFQAQTHGGTPATEWLWMNYPEPFELHDYRYLGDTYRERERIQRKQKRWKARLQRMSRLERYALLDAISQLAPPAAEAASSRPPRVPDPRGPGEKDQSNER